MKKTAFISDIIFTFFLIGVVTLCLFRSLSLSFPLSTILASVCGGLAACAVAFALFSKRKTFLIKKKDELFNQKLSLHLALLPNEEKTQLVCDSLCKNGESVQVDDLQTLSSEQAVYFLRLRFAPVTADELAEISRQKTDKQKILLCSEIDDAAARLCSRLGVECKTQRDIYALCKKANTLPENYLGDERVEHRGKKQLRLCFSKANARRFLVSGSLILLSSLITPFPFYYWFVGGILLFLAVIVRIFGYE